MLFASFLIPAVALGAGVSAVALPILIHLLSRQRFQVVEWAAMRFLVAAQKQSRRRIDRWLLLSARVLALILPLAGMCAVMPWAEDAWQAIRPGAMEVSSNAPRTHRVLVLDASLSMTAKRDGNTRFEEAVKKLEATIQAANPGDGFSLIVLANGAQAVVPGPSVDTEKVLTELRAVKPTHGNTELPAGLAMIADTLSQSPRSFPRRQVLLVTDLQRSAWAGLLPKPDGTVPEIWRGVLSKSEFAVVDVGTTESENIGIVDLSLPDPVALVDAPATIVAMVQNFGKTDRKNIRLELVLGRPSVTGPDTLMLPVLQRPIETLPAGQRTTITFSLEGSSRFREPGLHLVQLKILDGDMLTADDTRTLAVDVREALPVVLVNGKPSQDPLQRASEYLMEALEPGGKRFPGNPMRPKTLTLTEFSDPALGDLTNVDCVYLCDVPTLSPAQLGKLSAHLKRGGGVIIGLGPNAAANQEWYNRVLFANGAGLLPGAIGEVKTIANADDAGFRLVAEDDGYRRMPLAAFRDDNSRAALTTVPFKKYITLDAPTDGRARRVLSFMSGDKKPTGEKPTLDPAMVEWNRDRGKVIVFTSTWNNEWNDWPVLPTFLPFIHELTRHAAITADRRTLRVHDTLEEFLPATNVGLPASITGPEGIVGNQTVLAGDETGIVRFSETTLAGLYRVSVGNRKDRLFAVNTPETTTGGGSESDLRRLEAADLKPLGNITVTIDPTDLAVLAGSDGLVTLTPKPHGPAIARILLILGLALMILELGCAWFFGPGRTGSFGTADGRATGVVGWVLGFLALTVLAVGVSLLVVVGHAEITGRLLEFAPDGIRTALEQAIGVPTAAPGEGTRWRLERSSVFMKSARADQQTLLMLGGLFAVVIVLLYRREARATGSWRSVALPLALRLVATAVALYLVLPQTRIAFDREGWPDVAVLLDVSGSMATTDPYQDPELRAAAQKLAGFENLAQADRLKLAKLLVLKSESDVLRRLLDEKQVKVHIYTISEQARLVQACLEPADLEAGRAAIEKLTPEGESSRLADGVQAVLKAFRGGSLESIICYTDGVITHGEGWEKVGRDAARAGVPLYLVGIGENREPPDVSISDLKVEDVVLKNDELMFEARISAKGFPGGPNAKPMTVPVILYERQGEKLVELARQTVPLDPSGAPVPVKLSTIPAEAGEKTYVLDIPAVREETEAGNNRLERTVLVTENKKLKVLYIDAYPRYEFRFLKVLLERESDAVVGNKSMDLSSILLDASPGYAEQDKSALRTLPTKTELMVYDVVLFGDVDPANLSRNTFLNDLAEFVQVKGGGLLFLAGTQSNPSKLFGTPLGSLLPIIPAEVSNATDPAALLVEGYRMKLTPYGRSHPLMRLTAEETENTKTWASLKPLFWSAGNYKRKAAAEVLATHPDKPAEGYPGENHPLVLQQFVGAGRVMFFGFDESWRWRYRSSEEKYNQFWMQAVRTLSRSRVTRAEVRTDKQTAYRRDEPIRVTVRFPDDAPAPAAEAPIKVQIERSGKTAEVQNVTLSKVEGTRSTYQTLLTRTPEGDYKFTLTEPSVTGSKPRATAKVLPPPGERDRIDMNKTEMLRAATESRGKFYTLLDANKLLSDLPDAVRVPLNQPVPPVAVWNHAGMFALILSLFGLEWILRRRTRLM
ncbi:MAG: VWA domain-containing protein [Fimbriiglobus sp.]